jgi:hypothetical protein
MKAINAKLKAARANVGNFKFGTDEWESAMVVVRALCEELAAVTPKVEFCSIDSGEHRTRCHRTGKIS